MKKTTFLLSLCIFYTFISDAQQVRRCGAAEYLSGLIANDPAVGQRRMQSEALMAQWTAAHAGERGRSVVTIPVVFHLLYNDTSQYLDDAVIHSQMDVINEDYRRLNADSGQTPIAFRAVAADCEIEFCLATRTPTGQLTNGIIHKFTTTSAFQNFDDPKFDATGGDDSWDATRYLNIWVAAFQNANFLGLGTFPNSVPLSSDGIVVNYKACGRIGTHLMTHYNKGRSLTHEIGHWLNLLHVWGDDGGTCGMDDSVNDTPSQASENYGCPAYPHTDNCSSTFPGIMFMNYLDYTDDECMNIFTEGQKIRMLAALNIDRASILTSNGCLGVGIDENDFKNSLSIYPNPATEKIFLKSNLPQAALEISITDLLGKTVVPVQVFNSDSQRGIDISMLEVGVYFLKVHAAIGEAVFKLAKE